jgi:hypothetical protein
MRIASIFGLLALASCAQQPAVVYWTTQKNGVEVCHHVVGRVDTVEKLANVPSDLEGIPDGQKGFKVVEAKLDVLPKEKAKPSPTPKKEKEKKASGDSRLADEVHDLRSQVKSLKEQVSAIPQPTPAEQPAQQEAEATPTPRMSQ